MRRRDARADRYVQRVPDDDEDDNNDDDDGDDASGASFRTERCTRNSEFGRCNNRRAARDIPRVRGFIIPIGQTATPMSAAGS